MRSIFKYIITPDENRYNNVEKIGDSELIVNTEISNHKYVSRYGIVLETPVFGDSKIKVGDKVVVHHNVFRRFHDVFGKEKNSSNYFEEDKYFVFIDQIFMCMSNDGVWRPLDGYCFVEPVKEDEVFSINKEKLNTGVMLFADKSLIDNGLKNGDKVGFTPHSEYEFIIDGKKTYRVLAKDVCVNYGDI